MSTEKESEAWRRHDDEEEAWLYLQRLCKAARREHKTTKRKAMDAWGKLKHWVPRRER
jgi:hypothetical protein